MPLEFIRNDITQLKVDAIVNAANSRLLPGGGVCGAIFSAAGFMKMDKACRAIGHCDVGQAVITPGFALPASNVIHAVGPIWRGGGQNEAKLLRSCYTSALLLAEREDCQSIAFPLISSGIYGYPKAEALEIAVSAIRDFLLEHEMQVYLVLFDRKAVSLSTQLQADLKSYIDDNYVQEHQLDRNGHIEVLSYQQQAAEQADMPCAEPDATSQSQVESEEKRLLRRRNRSCQQPPASGLEREGGDGDRRDSAPWEENPRLFITSSPKQESSSLQEMLNQLDESFSQRLLRLIDEKGMTDVEVYKRANIDRKLFSKIRKNDYKPSKPTALALAIALQLNLRETSDLLSRAGYSLSPCYQFDLIVKFFILEGLYDIDKINEALFDYNQPTL